MSTQNLYLDSDITSSSFIHRNKKWIAFRILPHSMVAFMWGHPEETSYSRDADRFLVHHYGIQVQIYSYKASVTIAKRDWR